MFFKTLEYLRFITILNGILALVVCASYLLEPLSSFDIPEPTDGTEIILNLHSVVYFFISMLSLLSVRFNHAELMYINHLQVIHYLVLIASNVYLYWESVLTTWTTLMMNLTLLAMYLLPFLPESNPPPRSLTLGSENAENVF